MTFVTVIPRNARFDTTTDDSVTALNTEFVTYNASNDVNPSVHHRSVQVSVTGPEEPKKRPIPEFYEQQFVRLVRKPIVAPRGAPFHTKWRLMQQRPRDGLIS